MMTLEEKLCKFSSEISALALNNKIEYNIVKNILQVLDFKSCTVFEGGPHNFVLKASFIFDEKRSSKLKRRLSGNNPYRKSVRNDRYRKIDPNSQLIWFKSFDEAWNYSHINVINMQTVRLQKLLGHKISSQICIPYVNYLGEVTSFYLLTREGSNENENSSFSIKERHQAALMGNIISSTIGLKKSVEQIDNQINSFANIFIKLLEIKNTYMAAHCRRVPELSQMIASAINSQTKGPFADVFFSSLQIKELALASLLHDVGKVNTPSHILEKSKKLELITDRYNEVELRAQLILKDMEIQLLREKKDQALHATQINKTHSVSKCNSPMKKVTRCNGFKFQTIEDKLQEKRKEINSVLDIIKKVNEGQEVTNESLIQQVHQFATDYQFKNFQGKKQPFLDKEELINLSIIRGTLNNEERDIINDHVKFSHFILKNIPFPPHLKMVPEIAANHHEKINGKGHPRGLKGDELSIRDRILAIVEIFEALTDGDRPYKKGMGLKEARTILRKMSKNGEIDKDLVELLYSGNIIVRYANKHLAPYQMDLRSTSFKDKSKRSAKRIKAPLKKKKAA